jgi:SAM-dependent methyltransferase
MKFRTGQIVLVLLCWAGSAAAESSADRFAAQVAEKLGATAGATVADIGAGDGQYAIAMSKLVGFSGTVFATELEEEDRNDIQASADEVGASNVQVRKAEFEGTGLPAASVDGIYLRRVYHHITAPEPFVKNLFETIRPGGRLLIVDFPPSGFLSLFPPEGIPQNRGGHGIVPALVVEELEGAGFKHVETIDEWDPDAWFSNDFGVVFVRPASN